MSRGCRGGVKGCREVPREVSKGFEGISSRVPRVVEGVLRVCQWVLREVLRGAEESSEGSPGGVTREVPRRVLKGS